MYTGSLRTWEGATVHIAHRTKSEKSCDVQHIARRWKNRHFLGCRASVPGPAGMQVGLKKESFSCLYSWDVGRFQMAGRCSEQPISVPSESSAYPDF